MTRSDLSYAPHKQVSVKVNTLVDEGIAPLVEALSPWKEIRTFESCEGGKDLAFVMMEWGDSDNPDITNMAVFVDRLATSFAALGWGCGIETVGTETHISIRWFGDKKPPYIMVELPSRFIEEAARVFSTLENETEERTSDKRP
jgi:hypothetical protein